MNERQPAKGTTEAGAYDGDKDREALARLRRIETRLTCLGRMFGYRPGDEAPLPGVDIRVEGRTVLINSMACTVGQINVVMTSAPPGTYTVLVCGQVFGEMEVA